MNKSLLYFAAATLLALPASSAWAHPGHGSASFLSGLLHPITGIDHLIMLVVFGMLASATALVVAGGLAGRLLASRWLSVGVASASVLFLLSA